MLNTIRDLSNLCGISGRENAVREYIISKLPEAAEYSVDSMGNLLVFKKGLKAPTNTVMLAAHMDEVGMLVSYICDDGLLKFAKTGGVDNRVLIGKTVFVGINKINGVIGLVPPHLLSAEERSKIPEDSELYIDIGAKNKTEAENAVSVGDYVCFDSEYIEFGNGQIKGKALDDRVGCAVLLEILNSDLPFHTHFAFTVQEEVGLRGAKAAAFSVAPDYAVVIETTTAADIPEVELHRQVCILGNGAAVSFMDNSTVYDNELFNEALNLAKANNIKAQPKTVVAGGNDAGAIHQAGKGAKVITVSVPCRYLHSPSCVINKNDVFSVYELVKLLAADYNTR